jgi:hypothetical protein
MYLLIDPEWATIEPLDPDARIDTLDGETFTERPRLPAVRVRVQLEILRDGPEPNRDEKAEGYVTFDGPECQRLSYTPTLGDLITLVDPVAGVDNATPLYIDVKPRRIGGTRIGWGWTAEVATRAPQLKGSR